MRIRKVKAAAVIPLAALVIAGCGGSEEPPERLPGKTLTGETETGMRLTVDTFVEPADDPTLKRIEDWRVERGYPDADFHRVTADNTAGQVADNGRTVRFARDAAAMARGEAIEARFSCEVLQYEWIPLEESQNAAWAALREDLCADGPPKEEGIAPGESQVYFLVTDRDFRSRGIREQQLFGPRDQQLVEEK